MSQDIVFEKDIISSPPYLLKVREADLPSRTKYELHRIQVVYVAELIQMTAAELNEFCVGAYNVSRINGMLEDIGLRLGTEIVLEGSQEEFRSRLDDAHKKAYHHLTPSVVVIQERDIIENPSYLLKTCNSTLMSHTKTALERAGIVYVAELVQFTRENMRGIWGLGNKGATNIDELVENLGVKLGTEIIFDGPQKDFRSRLEAAHEKAYGQLKPEIGFIKVAGRQMLAHLSLPEELNVKIETNPVLNLAIRQFLGAQAICKREGLSYEQLASMLEVSSKVEVKQTRSSAIPG